MQAHNDSARNMLKHRLIIPTKVNIVTSACTIHLVPGRLPVFCLQNQLSSETYHKVVPIG
jgi:hypothetical protein